MASIMKEFEASSQLNGANAPYVEEQYESYLADPNSVDASWRATFDAWQKDSPKKDVPHSPVIAAFENLAKNPRASAPAAGAADEKALKLLQYIRAHRVLGSRYSQLDPLKRLERTPVPELELSYYGLTEADMEREFSPGSWQGANGRMKLRDIVAAVKKTSCGTIGIEYMYISNTAEKRWIQKKFEGSQSTPSLTQEQKRWILERITASETLERYLHTRYVGQKRFSGEGGESMIPMLDTVIENAGANGAKEVVIGMAHRGRLNVLVNTLGKIPADLFSEFEGKHADDLSSGDVKYHQGFSSDIKTQGGAVHLTLAFNPSHLEIVNPVVEGSVRARQHRRHDHSGVQVLPLLIHGDAAFAGQGVIMETMALSQTRGYKTGGTVHIVVNNQIGFTTSDTRDARSSLYCTDIAKMIEAPVFHVNGDDPEAAVFVSAIAEEYRRTFQKDVVVDLVCFRRLGHNEQDEPFVTQPLMYKKIAQHPGTRKLYADKLEKEGVVKAGYGDELVTSVRAALDAGKGTNPKILYGLKPALAIDWAPYIGVDWRQPAETAVPIPKLKELAKRLTDIPANFKLHPSVERLLAARREMGDGKQNLDWGMAENLAYASLVEEGHPVRLSGQDSGRGTFAHRHAVLHDQNREKWDSGVYIPLQNIKEGQGPEHSSARLERFMQLCADHNMQVCVPSNAAQFFHMIRRQVERPMRKPLIVMTPKSLLRKKEAASSIADLAGGSFQVIVPEVEKLAAKKVKRVVFCAGKVYYDIVAERAKRGIEDVAVERLEQLYPFPHDEFQARIDAYPNAKHVVWAQEEPGNQGAWHRIQHYLHRHLRPDQNLSYAGRASSASPAVGYMQLHTEQQKELVDAALGGDAASKKEAA